MKKLMFALMFVGVVGNAAPLEITDYSVTTNYGKFERCKILKQTEFSSPDGFFWNKEGYGFTLRKNDEVTQLTTNWVVESTNLPISLCHLITYGNTNNPDILCKESVEPLDLPKDWKYIGTNYPIASTRTFRPTNLRAFIDCAFFTLTNITAICVTSQVHTLQCATNSLRVTKQPKKGWQSWK